ncbi:hypothetical protein [Roseateles sp.]|uniref:hypothetical protein n=1 Tax=Roseateles sp. TaxID=1971397 RepID=UPI002869F578|nr:hypothetical protein [Roseateles sp.]
MSKTGALNRSAKLPVTLFNNASDGSPVLPAFTSLRNMSFGAVLAHWGPAFTSLARYELRRNRRQSVD